MNLDHSSITKIFVEGDEPGTFRGTGFLVAPDCVLTCAHVLDEYIDDNDSGAGWVPPPGFEPIEPHRIRVRDELEPSTFRTAVLVKWDLPDLAMIWLEEPMAGPPLRLMSGLKSEHESVLSTISACVIGFSQSEGGKLIRRRVQELISSDLEFPGDGLLNIQMGGGLHNSMSGSPLLLPLGDGTVCAGMAQMGGEGRVVSRVILANTLVRFLTENNLVPSTVQADSCFTALQTDTIEENESLKHVRQLSRNAASDAGIIDLSFGESGEVLKLEEGLYVTRTIESEVVTYLFEKVQADQNSMVLIVGEAGYGKTSLLWHLYKTLPRSQMEPWFLKSASLSRQIRYVENSVATPALTEKILLSAIRKARGAGLQPVLLLDTVDLLLHEESDRDFLLEYLRSIFDDGCSVIVTCRHQEAKFLQPLKIKPFRVDQYDDRELRDAVELHVRRFYKNAVDDDPAKHLQNLKESVARGLPVREVCASPLMLRMLFQIYAPDSIPNEIHAFKLYQEYWDKRVQADKRPGSELQNSTNLERACCIVALILLSEGVPETDEQLVVQTAEQYGAQKSEIDALISRGILKTTYSSTLSFFHQTFFEHSAAHGMLRFLGQQGIAMLQTRMGNDWSDLFCGPVFEQVLLIGENLGPVRDVGETALSSLLAHTSITANTSGIYIYCHRRAVPDQAIEQVRMLLASASNPVVDFFLQVAPNLSATRLAALFSELEVIWHRKNWPEQQFALTLLERLAFREPELVKNFVTAHAILKFVIESEATNVAERGLLRVLIVLSKLWPAWSLEQFVKLYNGISHRTGGTDAPARVLAAVAECSVFLGEKDLATRFDAQVPPWQNQQVSNFDELALAYGRLWSLEWKASGVSLDFIFTDIRRTSDLLRLTAKLEGLANLLLETHATFDINVLFDEVLEEKTPARRWQWISTLLKRLMIGNTDDADEYAMPQVCLLVRQRLVAILIDENPGRDKDMVKRVRKMIHEAILSPRLFRAIFSPHFAEVPELWLTFDYLGELLAEGYIGNHPTAVNALEYAMTRPEQCQELLESTRTRLGVFVQMERRIAEQYLRLTFLLRAASGLAQALLGIADSHPGLLRTVDLDWQSLLNHLLHSPLGKTRRIGIALWQEMLQLNLTHAPQLADVFTLFDKEKDDFTRSRLLLIMGLAVEKSTQDIGLLIQRLAPLTASDKVVIQINSRSALLSAVLRSSSDIIDQGFAILDLIVQPPTNSKLIGRLGYMLEQLCTQSPSTGLEFCRRMLFSEGVAQLGTQSKRTVSFRLRSAVRALARTLSAPERKALLGFVPDLDHILGSIIVDAICHEHFKASVDLLDDLLKNPKVSPEIQNWIRKAKYARERTRGGKAWPELYAALQNAS
jgi:hypothetical protein